MTQVATSGARSSTSSRRRCRRACSRRAPAGTRLRQEALAEEFGVSRTPIREALRKLQASGLVELPNRGAVVRGLSPREIRDAYEVRAELEGLAAELAAQRISHEQLERLQRARAQFREALARMSSAAATGALATDDEIARWGARQRRVPPGDPGAAGNDVLVRRSRTCTGASRAT